MCGEERGQVIAPFVMKGNPLATPAMNGSPFSTSAMEGRPPATPALDRLETVGWVTLQRRRRRRRRLTSSSEPDEKLRPLVSEYVCDAKEVLTDGRRFAPDEQVRHSHNFFEHKMRGVNLGGWLVLQPWVTPSLFYQFEDQSKDQTALDMLSFCRVLGEKEGNRQLREHWAKWVTEADLRRLAKQGVNTLRVPVGDWMWEPYPPFAGCTAGSVNELHRVLNMSHKVGLRVLLDLHGVRRSQNGFDNSGHATNVSWAADEQHFSHWPCRSAGWQGAFDPQTFTYSAISWDNLRSTVTLLQKIAQSLRTYPAVIGLEALNEPWQFTPLDVLQAFYWDSYWAVRAAAPQWLFVVHDSFRLDEWHGFMAGCPAVALDTHIYQAWFDIRTQESFLESACSWRKRVHSIQDSTLPLIVGEWSLATDNCAMWLNGFHDNAPGYPKVDCASVRCPAPYVSGIKGPPQGSELPGPFGTGTSAPSGGNCPVTKPWDNEDEMMQKLAQRKLSAFNEAAGWFFWNFKVEIEEGEAHWSWHGSQMRGWLPDDISRPTPAYYNICRAEGESGAGFDAPPINDLPWYNSLPRSGGRDSPILMLLGLGIGTLIGVAVLLKVVLNILMRTSFKGGAGPGTSLELPPRLLNFARKTQGRKPGGTGVLGLKQRVSSRTLTQLAFPLMSREHAIVEETNEETILAQLSPILPSAPPRSTRSTVSSMIKNETDGPRSRSAQ